MSIPVVLGLFFALFGASLLRTALKNYKKAQKSIEWTQTTGKVKKVVLIGKRLIDGKMQDADRLQMNYMYTVDGKEYAGHQVAFYTLIYPKTYELAQAHPVESEINVYYNSINPKESVLLIGLRKDKPHSDLWLSGIALAVGVLLMIAGFIGWIV